MRRSSELLLVCLFGLCLKPAAGQNIDDQHNYPGGVAELVLEKSTADLPQIKYGIRDPATIDLGKSWRVLVGIELDTLPGEYVVYIKPRGEDSTAYTENFSVVQRVYPIKEHGNLLPVRLDYDRFSELDYENSNQPELPLIYPVNLVDQWSDDFGHLVQEETSESLIAQNYISLTTTAITTVLAPQNAIVSRIVKQEDAYATVFLDHGRGLYSIISGVDDLVVDVGNGVIAGAVIGKLPANSSFDKPHTVTWQCLLNGVYINPVILTVL